MANSKANYDNITEAVELLIDLMEHDAGWNNGHFRGAISYLFAATSADGLHWSFRLNVPPSNHVFIEGHTKYGFQVDLATKRVKVNEKYMHLQGQIMLM